MLRRRANMTPRYTIERNFHGVTARHLVKLYVNPNTPPNLLNSRSRNAAVPWLLDSAALPVSSPSSSSPRSPRFATTS